MNIETELKELILSRFGTMKAFSEKIELPNSTIDSIFRRGVNNASITNIIKICKALEISADALADGRLEAAPCSANSLYPPFSLDEISLIKKYRQLDPRGRAAVMDTVERELLYSTSASRAADAKKLADDVLECMAGADLNEPVRKASE